MAKIFIINPKFIIRSFPLFCVMVALGLFLADCSPEALGIAKDSDVFGLGVASDWNLVAG